VNVIRFLIMTFFATVFVSPAFAEQPVTLFGGNETHNHTYKMPAKSTREVESENTLTPQERTIEANRAGHQFPSQQRYQIAMEIMGSVMQSLKGLKDE
jgi:hypothetical protein